MRYSTLIFTVSYQIRKLFEYISSHIEYEQKRYSKYSLAKLLRSKMLSVCNVRVFSREKNAHAVLSVANF